MMTVVVNVEMEHGVTLLGLGQAGVGQEGNPLSPLTAGLCIVLEMRCQKRSARNPTLVLELMRQSPVWQAG